MHRLRSYWLCAGAITWLYTGYVSVSLAQTNKDPRLGIWIRTQKTASDEDRMEVQRGIKKILGKFSVEIYPLEATPQNKSEVLHYFGTTRTRSSVPLQTALSRFKDRWGADYVYFEPGDTHSEPEWLQKAKSIARERREAPIAPTAAKLAADLAQQKYLQALIIDDPVAFYDQAATQNQETLVPAAAQTAIAAPHTSHFPCQPVPMSTWASEARQVVDKYKINSAIKNKPSKSETVKILLQLIQTESSGDSECVNPNSMAGGLMQLRPPTAKTMNIDDILDPHQNIDAGGRYLKQLLRRYNGDIILAAAAFNAGPGKVAAANRTVPKIQETQNYITKIFPKSAKSKAATSQTLH